MSDKEIDALLADVLKLPNEDKPRLALADSPTLPAWRKDLIRVQCAIARDGESDPFRHEWGRNEHIQRLLLERLRFLKRGFLQLHENMALSYRRGLLEVVTTDIATFIDIGPECLTWDTFPFLTSLHLTGRTERIAEFISSPLLERFRRIWFGEALCNDETIKSLASSSFLKGLQSLNLRFWGECDNKEVLAHNGGIITAEGVRAIAISPLLQQLQDLDITFHSIRAEGARAIADSSSLSSLRTLIVDLNEINDCGLEALAASSSLRTLRSLSVRNNNITHAGFMAFLSSDMACPLRSLRCSDNRIGPALGMLLSGAPTLASLEHIYIANCGLGSSGFGDLEKFVSSRPLRTLNVDYNEIGDDFGRVFKWSTSLHHLSAAGNGITDDALPATMAGGLSEVRSLNLNSNALGDKFAKTISENPMFSNLEALNLSGNAIGDEGVAAIRRSGTLNRLLTLSVSKDSISPREQEALVRRFGEGMILT